MKEIRYRLKTDYISDDKELVHLIQEISQEHQVILLVAPQGTGKSFYFQNIKAPSIIISPTRALTNQYFITSVNDKYGETISLPNTFFQSVEHIQEHIDDADFLVIDEIHKAVQYSSFAYQQTDNIIKAFDEFKKSGKPIILTTATPDILKCLKGFSIYDDIGAEIRIATNKEYVKEIRVMEGYSEIKVENLIKERYKTDVDSMQVVMINNTERVRKLALKLNDAGIKSIGIASKNKDKDDSDKEKSKENTEEKQVFKALTQNKRIDYNVLIATSWVDVGINFMNRNITDIYCMFDNEYSRGDFTLLWQFMARARKCLPVFYITKPVLTKCEDALINKVAKEFGLTVEEVKEDLQNMYNNGHNSKVYSYLNESFCNIALDLIDKYHNGLVLKDTLETIMGIYFKKGYSNIPKFSAIPIRFFLYKMMEKISFSHDLVESNTNCYKVSKCKNQNPYYELCSVEEIGKVKDYLTRLTFIKDEFITKDTIAELMRLSGLKLGLTTQLKPFIKGCELDLIMVNTKTVRGVPYYKLFFDYNIHQVSLCCDNYDRNFSDYGYAKYSKESKDMIVRLKPDIEAIPINEDEYFIDISCLDKTCDKMLMKALYQIE